MGIINEIMANVSIKGGVVEGAVTLDALGIKGSAKADLNVSEAASWISGKTGIGAGTSGEGGKVSNFINNRVDDIKRPYNVWKNMGDGQKIFSGKTLEQLGGWNGVVKSAGTYGGAAMAPRALDGSLNPMVNADGESDIAGIPFI